MDTSTPPDEPSRIDPLLSPPTPDGDQDWSAPISRTRPSSSRTRRHGAPGPERSRRPHAARGARAVALTASVVATGAIGSALAYSEGAWGSDGGTETDEPTESASADAVVDSTAATTPTSTIGAATPDDTASIETSTSDVPSTTADTTPTTTADTAPSTTPTTAADVASSGFADGVYLGTSEYTEWGDVQVEVTISDGRIVDIAAVEYPTGRKSSSINNEAIPLLEADAIALQSADVDIVSGATYTSRTYADSLQAALDGAAVANSSEATS